MSNSSHDRGRTLSWRKKTLFAVVTTTAFFLLLELVLALLGVTSRTERENPFVGFSRQVPLIEVGHDPGGNAVATTAPGKLVWFNSQSFPVPKPKGTRRVVCVGGSTTYGRPFNDSTSYCGWLRELLPLVDDSVRWEVINAGGVSYASYRVAMVMEELAKYEPDIFVVYTAHNEFLERRTYQDAFESSAPRRELSAAVQATRVGSVLADALGGRPASAPSTVTLLGSEVEERLNQSVGPSDYHRDDRWKTQVLRHYAANLDRMVSISRRAGANIVFVTPASNLRDCRPFKTESSGGLSQQEVAEVRRKLAGVVEMLDGERFADALEECQKIVRTDPRNAEAHFHVGRALFGLERYGDAQQAFERAVDEDVCPLRAVTEIGEAIHRVADRDNVPVVDFHQSLEAFSKRERGHACFGREYFYDHVHPTIDVHRQLSLWILGNLQQQSWVGGTSPSQAELDLVQGRIDDQIDTRTQGVAFRNLAKVLHWSGKFYEAASHATDALRLIPNDKESRYLLADCLANTGRDDEALVLFEQLVAADGYPRAYVPMAELLIERGRFGEAESYLIPALFTEPEKRRARVYFLLSGVHLKLGEYEFALELLDELNKLHSDDPATLGMIAEAHVGLGNQEAAVAALRRMTEVDSGNPEAHYQLGMALMEQDQLADARRHIEIMIQIDPSAERAINALQKIQELEAVTNK